MFCSYVMPTTEAARGLFLAQRRPTNVNTILNFTGFLNVHMITRVKYAKSIIFKKPFI